jgi:ribosomal protein S18 acetylase RimI-like enzyme/GNAT superfamily N-acetyltransferase
MGSIDVSQFSRLTEDRISDCVALSAEAGWNQTIEDWALFLRHGIVLGLRTPHGVTVASAAVLPYPDDFAWISMVLVTASRRRERIGTRILEACCAEIARRGLLSMLDATPAGERIYRPLGFEAIFNLSRWQGVAESRASSPIGIRGMAACDIPLATAIDAAAFGSQRKFLIESLFRRLPQLAFVSEDNTGFVLARPGRMATQIGPLVATSEDAADALLAAAVGCVNGPIFLDLVDGRAIMVRHLQRRGFSVQRPFLRMGLKRRAPFGDPTHLFVAAGPEFG